MPLTALAMPPPPSLLNPLSRSNPFTAAPGEIHWGGSLHISSIDSLDRPSSTIIFQLQIDPAMRLLWSQNKMMTETSIKKKTYEQAGGKKIHSPFIGRACLNPEFTGGNYLQSGIPKFPISVFPPLLVGRIPDFWTYHSPRRKGIRYKEGWWTS